uniref:Putative homeodomain transcription factor n=1 Tax=Corethrella appendiculata TaxID=1370023 RepID=U5ELH8_9DIPT
MLTVIYLATLRLLFLPIHAKWWVRQTSPTVFIILLILYLLQMLNVGIYSYNVNNIKSDTEHIVSLSEFVIPMILSLLLSVIHSQIVATASNNNVRQKLKKYHSHSNAGKKRERFRRKRRVRTQQMSTPTVAATTAASQVSPNITNNNSNITNSNYEDANNNNNNNKTNLFYLSNSNSSRSNSSDNCELREQDTNNRKILLTENSSDNLLQYDKDQLVIDSKRTPTSLKKTSLVQTNNNNNNRNKNLKTNCSINKGFTNEDEIDETISSNGLRKRNVNWNLPHQINEDRNEGNDNNNRRLPHNNSGGVDDDGFESLNGKSSSGGEDQILNSSNKYQIKTAYANNWLNGVKMDEKSDSDTDTINNFASTSQQQKQNKFTSSNKESSAETDEENDDLDTHHNHCRTSNYSGGSTSNFTEGTSITERNCVTTNSEDCSYSSEINHSDTQNDCSDDDDYDLQTAPTLILNPSCGSSDRISCTIWESHEAKKAEMSVLDISSAIIERVEAIPDSVDYVYIGVILSTLLSMVPAFCRLCEVTVADASNSTEVNFFDMPILLLEKASFSCSTILKFAFGETTWEKTVLILGFFLRLCLTFLFFFLLAVAERTFKQRFLYAKLFSHITSSRRAHKSQIPHFRLNKVRNIKTWLCVRSYLKRRGPQNSVDVIVSAAFILTLLLLALLSVEWLKDSVHLHSQFNLEALTWSCALGTFLLRFMTLGTKINKKYKSVSVLITEQINLYVQIEQKPNKKEELMISNNVLKLASDLLKELESPFKISGLSANPYLYTTVKVVILSALSGVLSEMLGFKLKLHKIKIK